MIIITERQFKLRNSDCKGILYGNKFRNLEKFGAVSPSLKQNDYSLTSILFCCITFDTHPTRRNITQFIYLWKTTLHVSGGVSTHHQEHTQLYLQHLVLVKPLLLHSALWKSWKWFECGVGIVLINTIPTSHSNHSQPFHNSGR